MIADLLFERPTERELALSAHVRRKAFHRGIAATAAALRGLVIVAPPAAALPLLTADALKEALSQAPEPVISQPAEAIFPAHVFAGDCDRIVVERPCGIREIQDLICKNLKVRRADLLSSRRDRRSVIPRQVAMYLCKLHTSYSMPNIGRKFGGRDHTTVLHAMRRVERLMETPLGTAISSQWPVEACDFVRNAVTVAEDTISTWGVR
jgi:hypothetical protein